MQQIVNYYFQKPWSGVDKPEKPLSEITGVPEFFRNWRYTPHPWEQKSYLNTLIAKVNQRTLKFHNLGDWLAKYDLAIPPYTKSCLYLLPGCLSVLTPGNRKQLAQSKDYFFIKTHYSPYPQYFSGEYVVQMVRHPGPVFVSYAKLLKHLDLEKVIRGQVFVGSWSQWHQKWKRMIPILGDRFVRLKYENVLSDKLTACKSIKDAIYLSYTNIDVNMPSFEQLRDQAPDYYGVGYSEGWEQKYTSDQKSLLYQLHYQVMSDLSYS